MAQTPKLKAIKSSEGKKLKEKQKALEQSANSFKLPDWPEAIFDTPKAKTHKEVLIDFLVWVGNNFVTQDRETFMSLHSADEIYTTEQVINQYLHEQNQ